jgi:hypothetical protein
MTWLLLTPHFSPPFSSPIDFLGAQESTQKPSMLWFHSEPGYSWKVGRTCLPSGGEEHVTSWEHQHFSGHISLPEREQLGGGISQLYNHDDQVHHNYTNIPALSSTLSSSRLLIHPRLLPPPSPYSHPHPTPIPTNRVLRIQKQLL